MLKLLEKETVLSAPKQAYLVGYVTVSYCILITKAGTSRCLDFLEISLNHRFIALYYLSYPYIMTVPLYSEKNVVK